MKITLKDGSVLEVENGKTAGEIAKSISEGLFRNAVCARVDGELVDVTADWSYGETDDGELAYTTKTRQLGTYIFCEASVAGAEEVPEEVPADDIKDIPDTGR